MIRLSVIAVIAVGCGGSVAVSAPENPSPSPGQPVHSGDEALSGSEQGEAGSDNTAAPGQDARVEARKERTRLYRNTDSGLEVTVDGVTFRPRVTAIRIRQGWGLRLEVSAVASDGDVHYLKAAKAGSLTFGGSVARAESDEAEHFQDERGELEDVILLPDTPQQLARLWPGRSDTPPLVEGESLELHVGLWGLGPSGEETRLVGRFLRVTLSVPEGGKPRALVTSPE